MVKIIIIILALACCVSCGTANLGPAPDFSDRSQFPPGPAPEGKVWIKLQTVGWHTPGVILWIPVPEDPDNPGHPDKPNDGSGLR